MKNYAKKSLEGLWIGDCIGNLGQLYFVHDILKALDAGMSQYGNQLEQFSRQFAYSDDTEEAIVLYNHLQKNVERRFTVENICKDEYTPFIHQDILAMEFATRYYSRDPDGEIYGYGLNTRKVLRDIYEGIHWTEANKIFVRSEGTPSHVDSLVYSLSSKKDFKSAIKDMNNQIAIEKGRIDTSIKQGSCGNGSAMRVAPLGAFLASCGWTDEKILIKEATLQAEVTHCHPEGIAGSIAVTYLTYILTEIDKNPSLLSNGINFIYAKLMEIVPQGQVRDGIERASKLPIETPVGKAIEVLGNGQNVTCQDTVPLCIFLSLKGLLTYDISEMYEKTIIETSMAFGDVDTNCAIVGGMIGVIASPPVKWINFCKPMEDVI